MTGNSPPLPAKFPTRFRLFSHIAVLFAAGTLISLLILAISGSLLYSNEDRPRFLLKKYLIDLNELLCAKLPAGLTTDQVHEFSQKHASVEVGFWQDHHLIFSNLSRLPERDDFFRKGAAIGSSAWVLHQGKGLFTLNEKAGTRIILGFSLHPPVPTVAKTFLVLLLVVSGIFSMMYFFLRRLLAPIGELLSAVHELSSGHFRFRLPDGSGSEFDPLKTAVNRLAERMESAFVNNTLVIGNVAHDMKSYLTRLRLAAEVDIPDLDARREFINDIRQLNDFLDRTLEAYRLGSHQATYKMAAHDIGTLVAETIAAVTEETTKAIVGQIPQTPILVALDASAIRQLLWNLLSNAVRHGTNAALALESDGSTFSLTIRNDCGHEYSEADMAMLAQPFFQPDPSRRPGKAGSGLGLFIARHIAEIHSFQFTFTCRNGCFKTVVSGPCLPGAV
jgi:signal transduction histidine kinase